MIKKDEFLSGILDINCGCLDFYKDINIKHLNKFDFIYGKTDISKKCRILPKSLNFYLIETSIILTLDVSKKSETYEKFEYNIASLGDSEAIKKIAYHNFFYDRFHKDVNIDNALASSIKKEWVNNHFLGIRGDKCFIYKNNREIGGFLLTKKENDLITIDLIAVNKEKVNTGIGSYLIRSMLSYYFKKNKYFKVGTQINNTPSISLYKSFGFTSSQQLSVWHRFNSK